MVAPVIAAAAIGGGLGLLGSWMQKDAADEALSFQQEQAERGIAFFNDVYIPTAEELKVQFTPLELSDFLANPIDYDTTQFERAPTAMEGIEITPEVLAAQREVLGTMGEVAREGYTAQEQADLARMKMATGTQERGQREAIIQRMQQKGVGGSGAELAAMLIAQQGGANRAAQMGLDIAATGQQRALQALMEKGQLAGRMRGQEFGEKRDVASPQDVIEAFNKQQARETYILNKDRLQAAEEAKQRYRDLGVVGRDTAAAQAAENLKWISGQEMQVAGGKSGIAVQSGQAAANLIAQQGETAARTLSGVGTAIVRGADAYDRRKKDEDKI